MSRRASRNSVGLVKPAHQAAFAAAAFENLRLEHKARPVCRCIGEAFAGCTQYAARDGKPVAAQQGFSVVFG